MNQLNFALLGSILIFIFVASDFVAEDIEQGIAWIKDNLQNPRKIKTMAVFDEKITLFEKDLPDIYNQYRKLGW